jgi:iron complex transport system substrate-binding protein
LADSKRLLTRCFGFLLLVSILALGCAPQATGPAATTLPSPVDVQRVVSLSPSTTELLFALGLGDKVVGVTEYCDYPEKAKSIAKIGGYSTVDIEKVVSLKPDLVLTSDIHADNQVPALQKLGIKTVAFNPLTLSGLLEDITRIGNLAGQQATSAQLRSGLESRIKSVTGRVSGLAAPRVLYFYWHDPIWTSGTGTLADDVIRTAGGQNIASGLKGAAIISLEAVLSQNPEVIVVATGHGGMAEAPFQFIVNTPALKATDATKNNRVYTIEGDTIERSGPRIVDALEAMAGLLHPVAK